jgi:hypothetical protein
MPQARIDFYLQGATVQGSTVPIGNGSTGTVTVQTVGSLVEGDTVRLGLYGVELTVVSIPSPTEVELSNASGASVSLTSGLRLINLSRRPTVYQDQLGAIPLTSPILADSGGRATVYIPGAPYDYVISGDQLSLDTSHHNSISGANSTLSWNHTASGDDRIVLVGIAWQESLGMESLDSVTYDGEPMTSLVSNTFMEIFALLNPPTGTKTILATWSGSGTKAAIGGSVSLSNVNTVHPFAPTIHSANASSASPSVTFDTWQPNSVFFSCLGVNTVPAVATATVGASQVEQWNGAAGSGGASTRTIGAGATSRTTADSLTASWTLSVSDPWALSVVEVVAGGLRLFIDEDGEPCQLEPFALNASHFQSLQEAIDALPDTGGTVLIPAGRYLLRETLRVEKSNVTIIGAGTNTIIAPQDPTYNPIDLMRVSADLFRISNLLLDGMAPEADSEGASCIVFDGQGVSGNLVIHCILENIIAQHAARYGMWFRDAVILTAINCEAIFNFGDGIRIQGTDTPLGSADSITFLNCSMSENGGIGASVGDEDTSVVNMCFIGCTFQNNAGTGHTLADVGIGCTVTFCPRVSFYSCYFEEPPEGAVQFLFLNGCPNAVVEGSWFEGLEVQPTQGVIFANCPAARCSSNTFENFSDYIIVFDATCHNSVEMCNRDMDVAGFARILIDDTASVVGMSRWTIGLPRVDNSAARPTGTNVKVGSLVWVTIPSGTDSNLQAWDGSAWKSIALT